MVEPMGKKKYLISLHKHTNANCLIGVPQIIAVMVLHASLRIMLCVMIPVMTAAKTVNLLEVARFAGLPLVNATLKKVVLERLLHAPRMWLVVMVPHARMV